MRRRIQILGAGGCICGAMMGAARSCDGSTRGPSPRLERRPWSRVSAWARTVRVVKSALVMRILWKEIVRGSGGGKEEKSRRTSFLLLGLYEKSVLG